MRRFGKLILILALLSPAFAQAYSCSKIGYTVVYINGVFTTKDEADREAEALWANLGKTYGGEPLSVKTGHNPTHMAGFADLIEAFSQVLSKPISNFDRDLILNEIHTKLDTRKVVLVGHSQGALYANEIYTYLLNHGEPIDAVGEYLVAAPTNSIADKNGNYLNSSSDSLLYNVRNLGFALLADNADLPISPKDKGSEWPGHSFQNQYLEEAPDQIVSDIQKQLSSLQPTLSTDQGDCFTPPDSTLANKAQGIFFAAGDPIAAKVKIGAHYEELALQTLSNWGIAAVAAAFGTAHKVAVDVGTYIGGTNGLFHAGEKKYQSTNFNIVNHLVGGNNEQVDGEGLQDLLNGNSSQGGAVILATVQDTNKPAPTPTTPSNNPTTPAVPVGPAPGFSPGGEGAAAPVVAADPAPQTQAAASVPVADTMAPIISAVSNVSIEATSSDATFASVTYTTPTATDDVDGTVVVSCAPTSGSNFALGSTTVTCSAADTAGNTASTTFDVGVYLPPVSVPLPAAEPIVINEVAWGGSFGAPSEQWVELYNNGGEDISLDDMVLSSADGSVYIPLSGAIAAHGYYILATSNNSIFNLKISGWNHGVNASLALNSTPVQLILSRTNGSATTTLDQTPAADACGSAWCAGSLSSTNFAAAGGGNPMPVTMERVSASVSGSDSTNWSSADGYDRYAYDFNQQWIIGTPYNPNSSHWPMAGFVCAGDTGVLTPGNSYTYRPASNNCHYLSGYSNYNWSPEAVLLKGTIGSSTMVTQLSNNSGPYKNLQTDASHTYDFSSANSGDTFTVVFFEFNNNVGGQYNAYYLGDMHHYLETGFQNDGTTASAPYSYQSISFVIP